MHHSDFEQSLEKIPGLSNASETISRGIHNAVLSGGEPVRHVVDVLHGKWLGHPLHPALTDFVVGAFFFGSLLNMTGSRNGNGDYKKAAQLLISMGTIAAVPTALAGMADYSTISRRAMKTGSLHAMLNTAALGMYILSGVTGRRGEHTASTVYSTLGLGVLMFSAWLGGKMSYHYRIGVNKAEFAEGPFDWTPVLPDTDLQENQARRVELEGTQVLVYRSNGRIYAIGAVCSHEGGPLEEGDFEGDCVQCPWHQSVFDLKDGSVVHGPATYPVAHYIARVNDGQIELRMMSSEEMEMEQTHEEASLTGSQL